MSAQKRDAALQSLENDSECTVMLASLGVCAVGLNLTAANQIILSDTWWVSTPLVAPFSFTSTQITPAAQSVPCLALAKSRDISRSFRTVIDPLVLGLRRA